MRVTALLLIGLLPTLGGCSSTRWNLTQSDDRKPSASADNVEYKYGNPWAKSAKNKTDNTSAAPAGLPPDLEAKLAEAKAKKKDVSELLKTAAQAELRGDLEAAKQTYLKVLESQPRHAEAHHRLAVIADQQQDHRTADHHYQQALALDRQNADLLSDLGYSHFLRGNLDQSERYLKEALEVDHYHQAAIWHLGHVYLRQGKPDAALTMFRQVRTEREAQQIVAEAFPQRTPTGSDPARGTAPRWDEFLDNPRSDAPTGTPPAQTATLTQLGGSLSPSLAPGATASPAVISPWNSPAAEQSSSTMSRSATATFSAHASGTSQPVQAAAADAANDSFWQGALTNPPASPQVGATSVAVSAPANSVATPQGRTPLPPPVVTPGPQATTVAPLGIGSPSAPGVNQAAFSGLGNATPIGGAAERAPATWPSPPLNSSQTLTADAARAAQLAMGAGPGTMFPTARPVTPAPQIQTVSGVATPQSDVRWAYGETTSGSPSTQGVNQAVWHEPPAGNRPAEPPPWNNQLAPPSPWNNWQSPAPPSNNWMIPAESSGSSTPSAAQGNLAAPPPNVLPPPWPGTQTPTAAAAPSTNLSAPLTGTAAQPPNPVTASPPQTNPGATTIPNWPYAPQRP